jgi:hypothetical protein
VDFEGASEEMHNLDHGAFKRQEGSHSWAAGHQADR